MNIVFLLRKQLEKIKNVEEFEKFKLMQNHTCSGYGTKLEDKFEYLNDFISK